MAALLSAGDGEEQEGDEECNESHVSTQRGTRARTAVAHGPRRRQQTPSGRSGTPTTLTDLIRQRTWWGSIDTDGIWWPTEPDGSSWPTELDESSWLTEPGTSDEAHHVNQCQEE